MPNNPFDDFFDDPWDTAPAAEPYKRPPSVDGQMDSYELVSELNTRTDIGSLLQNNPQVRMYQLVGALRFEERSEYVHHGSQTLTSLLLHKPPKAGTAEFVGELRRRMADEYAHQLEPFTQAVAFAVEQLLQRKERQWDEVKTEDAVLALHLQKAAHCPVSDAMRTAAEAVFPVVVGNAPEHVNAYIAAFGIDPAKAQKAIDGFMYTPDRITALRAHGVAVPANDDPEFRRTAIRMLEENIKYGNRDPELFRTAYGIPEAEYRQAVWIGLVRWVCLPYSKHTMGEFRQKLKQYNLEVQPNDPAARAIVIEEMRDNISADVAHAKALHDLFALSAEDMQPLREKEGKHFCLEALREETPDLPGLQAVQAILHIPSDQARNLVKEVHRNHLLSYHPKTPAWENALIAGGYMTADTVHEHLAESLRTGMEKDKSLSDLQKIAARLGERPAARLDANETVTFAKKRYLEYIARGELGDVEKLEQLCDVSLLRGTPEERVAANTGMKRRMEGGYVDFAGARKIQARYGLTPAELQTAAEGAAITHLGACWFAQLEAIRSEFPVEDALRAAKQASGKAIGHFAFYLKHNKENRKYESGQKEDERPTILNEKQCEQVLRTIAIGGYDPDAIEEGLRRKDSELIPAYEAANLPGFLILLRRCPGGFAQAFSRDDVRDYAKQTYLVPALEAGDAATAAQHIELTSFPKPLLKALGQEVFDRLFAQDRVPAAFAAARICTLDDAALATNIGSKLREDPVKILPHIDAIPSKVLDRLETEYFLRSYVDGVGLPSAAIYAKYAELKQRKDALAVSAFESSIREQLQRVTSGGRQDASITEQPFYRDIVEAAYPMNAGSWTTFERNEQCEDRTEDLAAYTVRDHYSFTVAPGQDMVLKSGRSKDHAGYAAMHEPLEKIHTTYEAVRFDRDEMLKHFDAELARETTTLQPPEAFVTREQKICGLFLEHMRGEYPAAKMKHMLLSYQYAAFQDIRDYLQGTRGRAEQSRNPEYAYLLELREFFADRLKDVARKVLESALQNPALQAQLPHYFRLCADHETKRTSGTEIANLNIDKLGLAPSFITQICKTLKQRTNRTYTEDEVRALIRDYEDRTAALTEGAIPEGDIDPAILGQIRSQRSKTVRAISVLSGMNVHPSEIRLGDVNLQQLLDERRSMVSGEYDADVFGAYMGRRFSEVFGSELSFIDAEIGKYEAQDVAGKDTKPKRVEAFITKNHTSAHARGTAGVCVSGDNPVRNEESQTAAPNQWQMPNYLQMILRDGETKLCKGCILMHTEEDGDQKILTVSMNPSSTYLYQVNEQEMFRQLREQLVTFAKDNGFTAIAVSKNPQIRTNRTGGLFERAMDQAIADTARGHMFSNERTFSYLPAYNQRELDFIWVAKKADTAPATELAV